MCLGGHLAVRCALDPRISAAVAYFATDLHSATLGANGPDDTLARCKEIKGELVLIHGTLDTHVPPAGRDLIRLKMREGGVEFSWFEVAGAQHAFIRDEMSKGRFDGAVTRVCWGLLEEVFGRLLRTELGERVGGKGEVEHVC
jgi:carboxymethylenebutenolidase